MEIMENHTATVHSETKPSDSFMPSPSKDELKTLYDNLSRSKTKSRILSLVQGYGHMYKVDHNILSLPLSSLFDSSCLNMSYANLLVKCQAVFQGLTISEQQCKNIEVSTRGQANSKLWFCF